MKILITGASSYVGARLYFDLKKKFEVIGTYHSNKLFPELELLDIGDKIGVESLVKKVHPDMIIHVAANASGSWCEKNPELAIKVNETGTKNIVDSANQIKAKVIYISSFEHANTKTLYGRTKEAGEKYVKEVKAGYIILRPCLIMGFSPNTMNDRPFNRLLKNITQHTPAVYDATWKFYPTWLKHIEEVIVKIIEKKIINEIIPISVPEIKTRFDLAKDLLLEFNIDVKPEYPINVASLISEDLTKLSELGMPQYTYDEMIKGIKKEIKQYLKKDK
jgi:dTDP-4-dehydrorhamnose reductase